MTPANGTGGFASAAGPPARLSVVVIGRNEGERLRRCFDSLPPDAGRVVYVDSGSTDGSVELARSRGIEVVDLDMSIPFTAARARNAGLARLVTLEPAPDFVQFVDGDCELLPGWIPTAIAALRRDGAVAAVSGRLRERFANATIYNRLCELEWRGPAGDVEACGGVAMMRVNALREAGGFDPSLIAGEEPELCFRLRSRGQRILRIASEMALHDAAMTRWMQWWQRSVRAGHSYAAVGAKHPSMWRRERRSILAWGVAIPVAFVIASALAGATGLVLLLSYPVLWARIFARHVREDGPDDAALYASSCVVGKFAELVGVARFWLNRLRGASTPLIEHK